MIDFEKLKNLDISKIDIKNLNVNDVLAFLDEHKDILGALTIGIVAVVMLFSSLGGYFVQKKELEDEIATINNKVEAVQTYEKSGRDIKVFLRSVPRAIDEDELPAQISDFASKAKVTITSIVPGERSDEGLVAISSIRIGVRATNYATYLGFIKMVEDSLSGLRFDSAQVILEEGQISAFLDVSSVSLKE